MITIVGSDGIWESDAIDSGWHDRPGFRPGATARSSSAGGAEYIMGRLENLPGQARQRADWAYEDVVGKGLDFYDGLAVPSITGVSAAPS